MLCEKGRISLSFLSDIGLVFVLYIKIEKMVFKNFLEHDHLFLFALDPNPSKSEYIIAYHNNLFLLVQVP